MDPLEQLIVALDFPTQRQALEMVDRLDGTVRWVKVGLELYLATGYTIIEALKARGLKVFLDLKLHDIPNTVASAVRVCGDTGASLLTIHAGGGPRMIAAAADAAPASLRLLAVTVLTSIDSQELEATGIEESPANHALRLGSMAVSAGAAGLICSPHELTALRPAVGQDRLLVVPGIRPADFAADDQRRTATALAAIRAGADKLVVGRPVTRAQDPASAAATLLAEIASAGKLHLAG